MNYWECLPQEISATVGKLSDVREIRLRDNKFGKINLGGRWFWFGKNCLVTSTEGAVRFGEVCDDFIKRACNGSVYAYEKMLAQGYFTLDDGSRIGVCGHLGANNCFRKYTSLCIRVAKYHAFADTNVCDSFIVAGSPHSGKTTFLRDFACKTSWSQNVAVVDERGEISSCVGFETHSNCDVFCFADKSYALETAVRTLSPDWIVCDELATSELPLLERVAASGVKLAASIHADGLNQLKRRLGKFIDFFQTAVLLDKNFVPQVVSLR